jgi:hypothetical protein
MDMINFHILVTSFAVFPEYEFQFKKRYDLIQTCVWQNVIIIRVPLHSSVKLQEGA